MSKIAVLLVAGLFATQVAISQDIDLDRVYCDPLGGQRVDFYEDDGSFYPYSFITSIRITETATGAEVHFWERPDCDGNTKLYYHTQQYYGTKAWELKPNTNYTFEVNTEGRIRSSASLRVYYDDNEDGEFDQFNDREYIFWGRRINQSSNIHGKPEHCGYYTWPALGWTNRRSYWDTWIFEWETDGANLDTKETRFRFMPSYFRPSSQFVQDACESGWVWNGGRTRAPYYGQTKDHTVIIGGCEFVSSPANNAGLFVDEVLNGEVRQPKRGGAPIAFDKPSVTFEGLVEEGFKMKYEILGPLPSQTAVYQATDVNGNNWIDISPSAIANTPNLELEGNGFKWTAAYEATHQGTNDNWVTDENGNPLTDGSFYTYLTGVYSVRMEIVDENGDETDCGVKFSQFTVQADNDITMGQIVSPSTSGDPTFIVYRLGERVALEGNVQNIGLDEIDAFVAKVEIKGIDNNFELEDTFNYDKNNPGQTVMAPGDIREITFPTIWTPQIAGEYELSMYVESINGDPEMDQNQFNNYLPRPTGGDERDGWEFENKYIIKATYPIDLVGDEVLYPFENPNEEDAVIQNRPFRPVVRFRNEGADDATEAVAQLQVRDLDGNVVQEIDSYVVEDVPEGRINYVDVRFPEIAIDSAGEYTLWARIDVTEEAFEVVNEGNEITRGFTVESGISGVYTVGTANDGEERNYSTILEAMEDIYFYGVSGDVTFELTDAQYDLTGVDAAWDFRSGIIGLGYNEDLDETFTMTWKAAANRALIRGGVTINMSSQDGYGVRFGQGLFNEMASGAPVNIDSDPSFVDFKGHIVFDGGDVRALRFVMDSQSDFSAPFYLGEGTHDVTLNGLIIESDDPNSTIERVRVPNIGDRASTSGPNFEDEIVPVDVNGQSVNSTYSGGIVLRATTFDLDEIFAENEEFAGTQIPIETASNNMLTNNDISGFGYGIVSLGIGGIFIETEESAGFENKNNMNNTYSNNYIHEVGRAGIALGYEQNSTVEHNLIMNVNPNDISDANDGRPSFDHAGIILGGLVFDSNTDGTKSKGFSVRNIIVDANRISGVQSDVASSGIKVEQCYFVYDDGNQSRLEMPDGPENVRISNNIIKDIKITDSDAGKYGIRLLTERETFGELLTQDSDFFGYKTRNDKIVNNTIILGQNENAVASNGNFFGISLQNVDGTEAYNNAIAITDNSVADDSEYAAAMFIQAELPENGGPLSDNNAYYISENSGAATVRLVELDPGSNNIYFNYSRNDFENLDQWSIYTGADKNSIEYNFLNDIKVTQNDVSIKRENGLYPLGSKLNNRGKRLSYLDSDKDNNDRGVTGERYDIGAEEFRGRLRTADVEVIRISEPAAYKSTTPNPETGFDFSNEEHIMTTAPINVVAQIRNDGSLQQNPDIILKVLVESYNNSNSFVEVAEFTESTSIPSTDDVLVDFMLDQDPINWTPETYSDYNTDSDPDNDYDVPNRYVGMEANITPRIKLEIRVGSDEDNSNNLVEKIVRFYIVRSELGVILSTVYNNENLQSTEIDNLGGRLNTDRLQQGFLTGLNWRLNPSEGYYDYDLFDRRGWEEKSVNYKPYSIMFWSDGGVNANDDLSIFEIDNVAEFLAQGNDENKVNLVSASQGLAQEIDEALLRDVFGSKFVSNPVGDGYPFDDPTRAYLPMNQGDPLYNVRGNTISEDRLIEIDNPSTSPENTPELDPYPIIVDQAIGLPGRSLEAFTYANYDDIKYPVEPSMGTAFTTLTNNSIYLGIEWRHISNISLAIQGIMDYLNTNGGFVIPIELSTFEANQVENKVMVEWATSSEINSSHFVVEKANASNEIFSGIANVKAQGNTSTETQYAPIFDENVEYGNTYLYRLKKFDLDGSWEYSDTREVSILGADLTLTDIKLSPNPSTDGRTQLEFRSTSNGTLNIEVYDMVGNALISNQFDVNAAMNNIELDLGNVATGSYTVVITAGDYSVTKTLNVTK